MRIDARSGNTNHGAAQRSPKASTNDDILTGKVLTNSSRMSSLHDLVKNRPFTANCEVQTCLFLSKDFPLNYNTNGGAERDRTADPLLAKQVLSQLSYSPVHRFFTDEGRRLARSAAKKTCRGTVHDSRVVGLGRVELPTSPSSGVRSNQLSYKPIDRALSSKVEGSCLIGTVPGTAQATCVGRSQ